MNAPQLALPPATGLISYFNNFGELETYCESGYNMWEIEKDETGKSVRWTPIPNKEELMKQKELDMLFFNEIYYSQGWDKK